jgi:4-hydroxy-tetrahydrodipicolinate synthase
MFEGLTVAMVTPFREGRVDEEAVDRLVDHLLDGGVDGIVPAGSTGESPVLTEEERRELFQHVRRRVGARAFVLAGTGTNSTASTLAQTALAREAGADGALVVTPYYNKPTQAGLYAHFRRVAEEGGLPLCLYNVPGRTGVSLAPETVRRLADVPGIVAIKEASGSLDQVSEICRDTRLTVLSGDDSLTLPMLAVGAAGVVSVVGNLTPQPLQTMLRAYAEGETDRALRLHRQLFPLARVLFIESNPGPVKHALARAGLIRPELRLPLVPVSEESARKIDAVVEALPREWLPRGAAR